MNYSFYKSKLFEASNFFITVVKLNNNKFKMNNVNNIVPRRNARRMLLMKHYQS